MTLTQIKSCIYAVDGSVPRPGKQVVLAIHPYYQFDPHSLAFLSTPIPREDYEGNPEYLKRFEELAIQDRTLITFEEFGRLGTTAERYRRIGRHGDTYFIKTWCGTNQPMEMVKGEPVEAPWEDVIAFLGGFEPTTETPMHFVGGHYLEGDTTMGCLNNTEKVLRGAGLPVRVLKEITF